MLCAGSMRRPSTQKRPMEYPTTYMANSRPGRNCVSTIDPQQQTAQREVPQRLVQERGVERRARRVAGRDLVGVDAQRPRQCGGPAEQLLVPPVSPTTDRLGEGQRRRRRRQPDRHAGCRGAEPPRCAEGAEEDAARDAEATSPDLGDPAQVVLEQAPVGDDVVQPGADHAGDHRPHGHRRWHRRACLLRSPRVGGPISHTAAITPSAIIRP